VTRGRRAGPWVRGCRVLVALSLILHGAHAQAEDPRNTYLIKLLQGSSQFRVRAQAAISLGAVTSSGGAVEALTVALADKHPAVRAAAARRSAAAGRAPCRGIACAAPAIIPAPAVKLVAESIRMKLPVSRLWA